MAEEEGARPAGYERAVIIGVDIRVGTEIVLTAQLPTYDIYGNPVHSMEEGTRGIYQPQQGFDESEFAPIRFSCGCVIAVPWFHLGRLQ